LKFEITQGVASNLKNKRAFQLLAFDKKKLSFLDVIAIAQQFGTKKQRCQICFVFLLQDLTAAIGAARIARILFLGQSANVANVANGAQRPAARCRTCYWFFHDNVNFGHRQQQYGKR
jgi:hypothetical protein